MLYNTKKGIYLKLFQIPVDDKVHTKEEVVLCYELHSFPAQEFVTN